MSENLEKSEKFCAACSELWKYREHLINSIALKMNSQLLQICCIIIVKQLLIVLLN